MKHVENILYERLSGFTGLSALVSQRIFPVDAPQNIIKPFITYQFVSKPRNPILNGPSYVVQSRVQVDCYSQAYPAVKEIAGQVRLALDGWRDTNADLSIKGSILINDFDMDPTETDPKLYRVLMEFMITHAEANN